MSRSDKGKYHDTLVSSFPKSISKEINSISKDVRLGWELRKIMNYIKSDGMYSEKQQEQEQASMDRLNTPNDERKVLNDGWKARHKLHDITLSRVKKLSKMILELESEVN